MLFFKYPTFLLTLLISSASAQAAAMNQTDEMPLDATTVILSTLSPGRSGRLDEEDDGPFSLSAAVKSIDAATADLAKSVNQASPVLSPILTAGAVSYVAYVALTMSVPNAVRSLGLPSLHQNEGDEQIGRSSANEGFSSAMGTTLMERLTAQFLKNVFRKTEFAGALMANAGKIFANAVSTIRSLAKLLRKTLDSLKHTTDSVTSILNSVCLRKYVCTAGWFTRANFPVIGMLLKNIRSHTEDEFAHALADGADGAKCNKIFSSCSL